MAMNDGWEPIVKSTFSACGEAAFEDVLRTSGAEDIIVCGIETHICVNQTAHALLGRGYNVHILADGVASRTDRDRAVGIEKMTSSGAIISCVEIALFEMLGDSSKSEFKAIQSLIK